MKTWWIAGTAAALVACSGSRPAEPTIRGQAPAGKPLVSPADTADPDVACGALRPETVNPVLGELPRGVAPLVGRALDASTIDLGALSGKVVLVNFGASWTASDEPATLNRLADAIGEGLVILRVVSEPSLAEARAEAPIDARYQTVFDHAPAGGCSDVGPLTRSWGVNKIPDSFLVDASGNVRYQFANKRDWSSPGAIACVRAVVRDGRTTRLPSVTIAAVAPACSNGSSPSGTPSAPSTTTRPTIIASGTIRLGRTAKPGRSVFLMVRRADANGEPMGPPLAVDKWTFTGRDLPFVLDSSMVMTGDAALVGELIVHARYDQDGDPLSQQAGDLTGKVRVKAPARNVVLVVDTPVH